MASARSDSLALAFRLAGREMRGGLKGFRIFLACLFLGVAAVAGVGSVSEAMLTGLENDARTILGGDLDLRLVHTPASDEQRRWMTARAEVSEVAGMRAMVRATEEGARRSLIKLRAVDSLYPLYGEVVLSPAIGLQQALGRRDGVWGAAADGGLMRRLDLQVGDLARVGDAAYRIAAVLEREPDSATRGFTFGPSFLVAKESLAETGLVQPGSLISYHYRLRLRDGVTLEGVRADLERDFPEAGWRVTDTGKAAPRVSRFIERLTVFLTLIGLTSLLVAGVGIGNAVRSYLEEKTATIATLKCLGAPSRLIFRIYMTQILCLALFGLVAGLAFGAVSPVLADALIGDALGWRAAVAIYPGPLLLAAVFGLLTAVTFSLLPLAHARAVPPASLFRDLVARAGGMPGGRTLAALALLGAVLATLAVVNASDRWLAFYFVLGAIATLALFRLTGLGVIALARRIGRPRNPGLRLAVTNLHRPGAPTASVILSLGLGLTVLVAIALIEANLTYQVRKSLPAEAPAFYFIDIQTDQLEAFDRLVASLPGTRDLQHVPMLRGRIAAVNGVPPSELQIPSHIEWVFRGDRGLTWSRTPPQGAQLVAGEWWPADHSGETLVSLDAEVGEGLGIGPGDRLTINVLGRDIEVTIANLREIDWSDLAINFVMIFSPGLLETAPQTHIATVKADGDAEAALEIAVTDRFVNVSAIRVKDALQQFADLMRHIAVAVRGIAAFAILAGVLVLAGAVAAGNHRRVYDAVVLKVLGATQALVARAYLMEFGLLGLITAVLAAAIGSVAAYLVLTGFMHTEFIFLPATVAWTATLAAVITLAFGFIGTLGALRQKSAPLLRNE